MTGTSDTQFALMTLSTQCDLEAVHLLSTPQQDVDRLPGPTADIRSAATHGALMGQSATVMRGRKRVSTPAALYIPYPEYYVRPW